MSAGREDPGHDSWEELAVGHALRALEPEDEEAFVAHLRGCARCERVLAETEGAAADLSYAAPSVAPPERLRRRVAAIPGADERPTALPDARRRRAPRSLAWGRPWMAVAAGLIVVGALGLWNLVLHVENGDKQRDLNRATAVLRCVEDPSCRQVPLMQPGSRSSRGAVLIHDDRVDVVVDGLAPNDRRSTTYVLWQGQRGGAMVAVAPFDVTCRSVCVVSTKATLPRPWGTTTSFAISREASRKPPPTPASPLAIGSVNATSA